MAQGATIEWLRQFESDQDGVDPFTHLVDKKLYCVPSRRLAEFYQRIQAVLGPGGKPVRERVPDVTPAFFTFAAPVVDDAVASAECVGALVQTGMAAVLGVEHKSDGGAEELSKVCVVLRSPVYTNEAGDEVESFLFLYPRLLVKRDSAREGQPSPLAQVRRRVIEDFSRLRGEVEGLVGWDPARVIRDEAQPAVLVYGSTPRHGLARALFRAYDERGQEVDVDAVFDQKERSLPACYLYSLARLARRVERAAELSPELKSVEELLQLLGSQRLDEPSDVFAIAQALYQASEGSPTGELMLEEFLGGSGPAPDRAHELWSTIAVQPPRYTTMTLRYMASRDNPVLFRKLVDAEVKPHLWKSTGPHGSHLDICYVLRAMYGHLFAYDDDNEAWYAYKGTHWAEKGERELREKLRTEMLERYERLFDSINRLAAQNENEGKGYKERAKACGKIIKALGERSPKNAIIGEAADLFAVDDLDKKLDGPLSYNTFAFADCVYNLDIEHPENSTFSDGRPEDFRRRSSSMRMRGRGYSMEHPDVKMLLEYLRQCLASYDADDVADDSVMWYMVDRIAVCLEGGNRHKHVTIGEGPLANNSKSTFESIVQDGFGSYSTTINTSKVIGKRRGDGDGPTPALKYAQGANLLWIKETSKGERVNAGMLLELSSGLDPITLRDPHSKRTVEVIPSYKIFFFVNNSPKVDADESGLWVRVRMVLWLSQFLPPDQVPEDEREQRRQRKYPIDPNFAKKRALMVAPMMWLLCERYKVVGRFGPKEPKQVLEYVERYKRANDVFQRFAEDVVEEADGSIEIDALYTEFAQWYKRRYPQTQWYSQDDLHEWMVKHHGAPKWGTTWEGIRMRPRVQRVAGL